jgi:AcrR family transcriptional regulator
VYRLERLSRSEHGDNFLVLFNAGRKTKQILIFLNSHNGAMKSTSINPRKRPKQARAQVTFDAILQAATRILATRGLGSFNTNHVAEVAGVSVGTLYQYFPTKEAILTQIIRQKRKLLLDGLMVATKDMVTDGFDETLDKLLLAAIAQQLKWPRLARTLDYAEAFSPLEAETDALKAAIIRTVAAFL